MKILDTNLPEDVIKAVERHLGQDDSEDAICDDTPDGVRPAAGGEQCPETDAGIDSTNQSNQGVNNG